MQAYLQPKHSLPSIAAVEGYSGILTWTILAVEFGLLTRTNMGSFDLKRACLNVVVELSDAVQHEFPGQSQPIANGSSQGPTPRAHDKGSWYVHRAQQHPEGPCQTTFEKRNCATSIDDFDGRAQPCRSVWPVLLVGKTLQGDITW